MRIKLGFLAAVGGLLMAGGLAMVADKAQGNGVDGHLPHADGRLFETLDAYLAYLEDLGTIGIAWYERRPDGTYQLITRRPPGQAPEIFTREDLLERFGFAG